MKRLSTFRGLPILLLLVWPCWSGSQGDSPAGTFVSSDNNFYLESPRPGSRLSEIKFAGADNDGLSLDHFRGGVVLLNIWATWCAPCREELPALDRLHAEHGSADFHVVALSIDNASVSEIKAFYNSHGIKNLSIYIDQTGRALQAIKSYGVPTTLLIDRQGQEIGRVVGPVEWDRSEVVAVINRYMASKP